MLRILAALFLALSLAACSGDRTWAPDDEVARARYVHDGPPEIALFTVVANRSDEGAHSAIMINGSERVIFDPAGTWYHPWAPIRHDTHFGITPRIEARYIDYHTRVTYRTYVHRLRVTPEVAERALALAKAYPPVPNAFCADSTSDILRQAGIPVERTMFPKRLMDDFSALPGVTASLHVDDDSDDNTGVLTAQELEASSGQ